MPGCRNGKLRGAARPTATLIAALLFHSLTVNNTALAQDKPGLTIETTPYLWASGIKGTVGIRDRTANVDVSFRKLLEHLDGALMLSVEARSGRWGFGADIIYVKVSDESATPGPFFSAADVEVSESIVELGPRFRVLNTGPFSFDFLAGGRWWRLNNELTLEPGALPGVTLELDESWIDPLVGARMFVNLASRWLVQARGDVGGFGVGSKFSWQALGAVAYEFSNRFTLRAGYRHLDVDYDEDDDGFVYDIGMGGPILGATIRF